MKVLNFTASALFVVLVFYLLIVGEALLLPLVIAIAFWYLINTLAAAFAAIRLGGVQFAVPALSGGIGFHLFVSGLGR